MQPSFKIFCLLICVWSVRYQTAAAGNVEISPEAVGVVRMAIRELFVSPEKFIRNTTQEVHRHKIILVPRFLDFGKTIEKLREAFKWIFKKMAGPLSGIVHSVISNQLVQILCDCSAISSSDEAQEKANKFIRGSLGLLKAALLYINKLFFKI